MSYFMHCCITIITINTKKHIRIGSRFLIYETLIANKKTSYSSFCFRLNIFVRSMNTVSAIQKTTKTPKVIQVAVRLSGA